MPLKQSSPWNWDDYMVRIGMAPGYPNLCYISCNKVMDGTPDQRQTAYQTKGVGIIHIPRFSRHGYLKLTLPRFADHHTRAVSACNAVVVPRLASSLPALETLQV